MMKRKPGRRAVAVVVGVLVSLTLVPASAFGAAGVTWVHIRGTVVDALGRPLEGARVRDGVRTVLTDANGAYDLREDYGGTYTLRVSRADTLLETRVVDAVLPVDRVVDFTLVYRLRSSLSQPSLSTATGPATSTLSIASWAPSPGSPGDPGGRSCVYVTDSRATPTSPATLSAANSDGSQQWTYILAAPQSTTEGAYQLTAFAADCATGMVLTTDWLETYIVDNTAPSLSSSFPSGWTTPSTTVGASVQDTGAGVDLSSGTVVVDGISGPASITYYGQALVEQRAVAGLANGPHTATLSAADQAGNASSLSFAFWVDGAAPQLSEPTPTTTVTTSSPRLAISGFDTDSGINPASVVMTLSNGLVTNTVTAAYDTTGHTISYQVPTTVQGARLGQFPLPDGTYTVRVAVRDLVGNASTQSWSFAVHALPI